MRVVNILIASVGGQGGLTLSRAMAIAAVLSGYSVRTGETLGMSQRFGSVTSFVRVGEGVEAPIFGEGEADYLIGMELTEVLRNLSYLAPHGVLITDVVVKPPVSSSLGEAELLHRDEILRRVRAAGVEPVVVPAAEIAQRAGSRRAANMALLGAFNAIAGLFSDDSVARAIAQLLPGRRGEISIRAYRLGKEYVREKGLGR